MTSLCTKRKYIPHQTTVHPSGGWGTNPISKDSVSLPNSTLPVLPHLCLLNFFFYATFLAPKYVDMFPIRGSRAQKTMILSDSSPSYSSSEFFMLLNSAFSSYVTTVCLKYLLHFRIFRPLNSRFPLARKCQKVQEWTSLRSDKYGFTLVWPDYKQTLCTLLCNRFAWCLNGPLDRPWAHEKPPTWKPSSAHQGNSADT